MALRASCRQSHPCRGNCICPIYSRLELELTVIYAAFAIRQRVAMKPCSDPIVVRCVRNQVARDLRDRKLVEWHIAIEGVNHPLAIPPGKRPGPILFVTIAIGVSSSIQPRPSHAFAEMGRSQEPVNHALVGI